MDIEMAIWVVGMTKRYSIAEARNHLPEIVHDVERNGPIEVTRRGKPVVVLLSIDEYRQLTAPKAEFAEAFQAFRRRIESEGLEIPPEAFDGLRDPSPDGGRDFTWP